MTVRLDSQTRQALEDLAKQEDRSAANMIERIVKEYLRGKGLLEGSEGQGTGAPPPRKVLMREGASFQQEK